MKKIWVKYSAVTHFYINFLKQALMWIMYWFIIYFSWEKIFWNNMQFHFFVATFNAFDSLILKYWKNTAVLISSGYYVYNWSLFFAVLETGKSKLRVPRWLCCCESCLPGCRLRLLLISAIICIINTHQKPRHYQCWSPWCYY